MINPFPAWTETISDIKHNLDGLQNISSDIIHKDVNKANQMKTSTFPNDAFLPRNSSGLEYTSSPDKKSLSQPARYTAPSEQVSKLRGLKSKPTLGSSRNVHSNNTIYAGILQQPVKLITI